MEGCAPVLGGGPTGWRAGFISGSRTLRPAKVGVSR